MNGWICRSMAKWIYIHRFSWRDEQRDGWMDRWMRTDQRIGVARLDAIRCMVDKWMDDE